MPPSAPPSPWPDATRPSAPRAHRSVLFQPALPLRLPRAHFSAPAPRRPPPTAVRSPPPPPPNRTRSQSPQSPLAPSPPRPPQEPGREPAPPHIVLIVGFETFNLGTYRAAAAHAGAAGVRVTVATDRQLSAAGDGDGALVAALRGADVVFCSLLFDYDQVEWLRSRIPATATVFVFESALELMSATRVGTFTMTSPGGQKTGGGGMPPLVRTVLKRLGILGRDEDKLAAYLSLLKVGPRLLSLFPGDRARDLSRWLSVYAYWNAGGVDNVSAMLRLIARDVLQRDMRSNTFIAPVKQIPNVGLLHPSRPAFYFAHPSAYARWYAREFPERRDWPRVAVLLYRKHVVSELRYINQLIGMMEQSGIAPLPVFITGVEAHIIVRDFLTSDYKETCRVNGQRMYGSYRRGKTAMVDAVVSTIGFPLVGGPAGSVASGRDVDVGQIILKQLNVPYMIAAPLLIQDTASWLRDGVAGLQSVVLYSLPELDGAIDTVCIGGLAGEEVELIDERVARLTGRLKKRIALQRKRNAEKKIAVVVYGFPPGIGSTGTAALLNVPASLKALLQRLRREGYDVGDGASLGAEEILDRVKQSDEVVQGGRLGAESARAALEQTTTVDTDRLQDWLSEQNMAHIVDSWKDVGSSDNIKTFDKRFLLGGVQFGNVWIGVQPPLGITGDPMRLLFDRDLTPHPQYAAFYRWLEHGLCADAVVHVGTHGTYEWLPGNQLGNTADSWSDILVGDLPNLYIYTANNPSESALAKRRGYATVISHNVPPYGRAALYGQLEEMKRLVAEFNDARQDGGGAAGDDRLRAICTAIEEKLIASGLNVDLDIDAASTPVTDYVADVSTYLKTLSSRLFSSGLHVLGKPPGPAEALGFAEALLGDDPDAIPESDRVPLARKLVSEVLDVTLDPDCRGWSSFDASAYRKLDVVKTTLCVLEKLGSTTRELDNVVRALRGEFIEALPGGDVLRDGAGVLPTGSNIHALDPYRMPSETAYTTGRAIAERVLDAHRADNDGELPETVAVPLWGLDNIKTKGESVGIALGLLGARPLRDGTGRVVRFELIPVSELGRPRVDVLLTLSGIFRDSFQNVVELLDDVCRRAAAADEREGDNFVVKHAREMRDGGDGRGADVDVGARIFSNPAGDYGSMVNEQVIDGAWDDGDELGATYAGRNSFVYGRGVNGRRDEAALQGLLRTTGRVVQQIDSVEYGLSDIQEYYANTGALVRAARSAQTSSGRSGKVGASVVESFGAARDGGGGRDVRDVDEVLRMEVRTRLLNPQWADAMLDSGAGGAFEVSARMTNLVGWGGTTGFGDDFVFAQAAERYVLDEENRRRMLEAPEAYRNVLARMLEAAGRGIWANPDAQLLARLRDEIDLVDSQIEGV